MSNPYCPKKPEASWWRAMILPQSMYHEDRLFKVVKTAADYIYVVHFECTVCGRRKTKTVEETAEIMQWLDEEEVIARLKECGDEDEDVNDDDILSQIRAHATRLPK